MLKPRAAPSNFEMEQAHKDWNPQMYNHPEKFIPSTQFRDRSFQPIGKPLEHYPSTKQSTSAEVPARIPGKENPLHAQSVPKIPEMHVSPQKAQTRMPAAAAVVPPPMTKPSPVKRVLPPRTNRGVKPDRFTPCNFKK